MEDELDKHVDIAQESDQIVQLCHLTTKPDELQYLETLELRPYNANRWARVASHAHVALSRVKLPSHLPAVLHEDPLGHNHPRGRTRKGLSKLFDL